MASPLADVDFASDVTRGVLTGLAFLVALAVNLDPERRGLALAVFGGGAVAFFGLAFLASKDETYNDPKLRWYLFAAWGVLLFAVGLSTESTVGVVLGLLVGIYAAVRAWFFDVVGDEQGEGDSEEGPGGSVRGENGPAREGEATDWQDEAWTGDALPPRLQPPDGDEESDEDGGEVGSG